MAKRQKTGYPNRHNSKQLLDPDRERRARAALRRDMRLAGTFERQVRSAFAAEEAAILAAVPRGTQAMLDAITSTRWEPVLAKVWLGQAPAAVWDDAVSELGGPKLDWRTVLPERVGPTISRQAASIADTSRDALRRALRDAKDIKAATAAERYRRAIRRLYRAARRSRASRVAVGVVVQATATVQHQAARAVAQITRAIITKTWVTVGDDRVRPSHQAIGGTTVPEDEPFHLAGGDLMYPRDPSGPGDEVYGCRCWAVYDQVGGVGTERGAVGVATEQLDEATLAIIGKRTPLEDPVRLSGGASGAQVERIVVVGRRGPTTLVRKDFGDDYFGDRYRDREVLATRLAERMNAPVVRGAQVADNVMVFEHVDLTPTSMATGFQDQAAFQRWLAQNTGTETGRQLGLYDYITGQVDRHPGNWFWDEAQQRVVAIDNGGTFFFNEYREGLGSTSPFGDAHIKVDTNTRRVSGHSYFRHEIQAAREAVEGMAGDFADLDFAEAHAEMLARLDALEAVAYDVEDF